MEPIKARGKRNNDTVEVFKESDGHWNWQRISADQQIVAVSGIVHTTRKKAHEHAEAENPGVEVVNV